MRQAGLAVPDAFLVDVAASLLFLETAPGPLPGGTVPEPLAEDLASCLDLLGPLAVRSSAIREDGIRKAAAGLYESVLDVASLAELGTACRTVVASQFSPAVRSYLGAAGELPRNEMAVVLQKMLRPEVSGVIFTSDPVRGRDDVFVLEACAGLGTAVVRGEASERATVRRDGEVEERYAGPGGAVLSEAQTVALTETAAAVESLFGMPVDVEWSIEGGRLFLLQARPITTGRWAT
jgi:pyruvate,water dikinase